ncbi:MAG: helix-turn-helix domain-containing protein [Alphaproteobacteria bacterium]|nr:helix-turn-helix domain-containing protein [Alphaproteobacteria bacterium]
MRTKRRATEADEIVGTNLRAVRILKGMSQEVLANHVGISFQQIQKYEKGVNRISAGMLFKLAEAMEEDPTVFLKDNSKNSHIYSKEALEMLALFTKLQNSDARESIKRLMKSLIKNEEFG